MRKNLKEARQRAGITQQQVAKNEFKIQTGLRIPETQYERIVEKADRIGIFINQMVLILVDIGLNYLDMEMTEQNHFVFHNPKDKS